LIDLSKEELAKLAKISGLHVSAQEAESLRNDLQTFLTYSQQIIDVEITKELEASKNVNVFRDDKVYQQHDVDVENVFAHHHDAYLVVPKILD